MSCLRLWSRIEIFCNVVRLAMREVYHIPTESCLDIPTTFGFQEN